MTLSNHSVPDDVARFTVVSDRWDRRKYREALRGDAQLQAIRATGVKTIVAFDELLCDLFCVFYKARPTLRRSVAPESRFNRQIIRGFLNSPDFERLRQHTHLDVTRSAWATRSVIEGLLETLQKQHRKRQRGRLQRSAFALRPWTWKQSDEANDGHGSSEQVIERKGQEGNLSRQIVAIVQRLADEADADQAIQVIAAGYGTESGTLAHIDPDARIALSKRFTGVELKRLAALVGRLKKMALSIREAKVCDVPEEVVDVWVGNDLDRILRAEFANLVHPSLRYDFLRRFVDRKLLQYDLAGNEPLGRGPLIVAIDTSGSMQGERELVAKAIGIALYHVAKAENRRFVGIVFGSTGEIEAFPLLDDSNPEAGKILEFAASFFGGGTDFETPLTRAMAFIEEDEMKRADVVLITDGMCEVSVEFEVRYAETRRQMQFKTISVFVTPERTPDKPVVLTKLSDQIVLSSSLDESVARRVFQAV